MMQPSHWLTDSLTELHTFGAQPLCDGVFMKWSNSFQYEDIKNNVCTFENHQPYAIRAAIERSISLHRCIHMYVHRIVRLFQQSTPSQSIYFGFFFDNNEIKGPFSNILMKWRTIWATAKLDWIALCPGYRFGRCPMYILHNVRCTFNVQRHWMREKPCKTKWLVNS